MSDADLAQVVRKLAGTLVEFPVAQAHAERREWPVCRDCGPPVSRKGAIATNRPGSRRRRPLVNKLPPFAVAKQAQRGRWFAGVGGEIVEQVQIVAGNSLQGGFVEQCRIIDQAGDEMVAIIVNTQAQVMVGAAEIDGEGVQRDGTGRQRQSRAPYGSRRAPGRSVRNPVPAGLQGFDEALEGQSGVCAGISEGFTTALQQGIGVGVGRIGRRSARILSSGPTSREKGACAR